MFQIKLLTSKFKKNICSIELEELTEKFNNSISGPLNMKPIFQLSKFLRN